MRKRKKSTFLTPEFLEKQKALLEKRLGECQREMQNLRKELSEGNIRKEIPGDFIDYAHEEKEKLINAGRIERLRSLIEQCRKALSLVQSALKGERHDDGRYGNCLICGEQIPEKRLKAVPWALLCVDCASAQETSGS
jgi:RNA polymerase-binding transcription factor DksA